MFHNKKLDFYNFLKFTFWIFAMFKYHFNIKFWSFFELFIINVLSLFTEKLEFSGHRWSQNIRNFDVENTEFPRA